MRLVCVCVLCALLCRGHGGEAAGARPRTDRGTGNVTESSAGFTLKVQVSDALSRQPLARVVVDVYSNYSRSGSALTGGDGGVLLYVPHHVDLPCNIVATLEGHVPALLPCTTGPRPEFSLVSVSLQRLQPGNIWLFEDSVLITSRTSGPTAQTAVRFPRSLLNVSASFVRALLSELELGGKLSATGIMTSAAGYVSMRIRPVAAVSVRLYSEGSELRVRGPVELSLTAPRGCGLQTSDTVPAWYFNSSTGGWMRTGLGTVTSANGHLLWTFTAPHLGDWMAAALSPTPGFLEVPVLTDFVIQHWFVLVVLVGGSLTTALCLLVGLLHHCRRASRFRGPKNKQHQSTSTSPSASQEVCTGSEHHTNIQLKDFTSTHGGLDPVQVVPCPSDTLIFYNEPVVFSHCEETRHRLAAPSWADAITQTLPSGPPSPQSQTVRADVPQGCRGLSESASVPVTLHRAAEHSRHSLHQAPPPQPARAWFVSLEGKPAAEMRYAVSEQQRRRRPAESRDTSLDSGVDVSELSQAASRRSALLERDGAHERDSSFATAAPCSAAHTADGRK